MNIPTFLQFGPKAGLYLKSFALLIALACLLGSLYFSEIAGFPPCVLCWWQRICIYPIVPILIVGILRKDRSTPYYILPLSIIGLGIAFFHNLLYWKIIPEVAAPCTVGVSCTTRYIEWFGIITIPLLSFLALLAITATMIVLIKQNHSYER